MTGTYRKTFSIAALFFSVLLTVSPVSGQVTRIENKNQPLKQRWENAMQYGREHYGNNNLVGCLVY